MTHTAQYYGDGEWVCTCGHTFGHSVRLANIHAEEENKK